MKIIFVFILVSMNVLINAQSEFSEGVVSFKNSVNVYVRFQNTNEISIGDTLYSQNDDVLNPCLIVLKKSSTSCVCKEIHGCNPKREDKIYYRPKSEPIETEKYEGPPLIDIDPLVTEIKEESPDLESPSIKKYRESIQGRVSAASYSSFSDQQEEDIHRTMLRFSLNYKNLNGSPLSIESYINYRNNFIKRDVPDNHKTSFLNVYNLSLTYQIDSFSYLSIGRKINRKAMSLGPIDGLQGEKYWGSFYSGFMMGFRPDITSFGLNEDLFEYGGYVGVETTGSFYSQTTVGLLEQRNRGAIDRRYSYIQHSSNIDNWRLFGSMELDLYSGLLNNNSSSIRLTNLYISLNRKLSKKINITVSYDSRKRIIYYESFRTEIEDLLADDLSRQGVRMRLGTNPLKYVNVGISYASRFQSNNQNKSSNINGYLSHSRLPILGGRTSINFNHNESNYLTSDILSIRHSRSIINRKLDGDFYYRRVNYSYFSNENSIFQQYFGVSLSYRISNSLRLSLLSELSKREGENNIRLNTKLIKRFNKR